MYFKDVRLYSILNRHVSCVYLTILVKVENGDCSGGGRSDNPVLIQKLQK